MVWGCTPGALAARDLGGQRVELLIPEVPVGLEPSVDLLQRGGIDCSLSTFRC
jgi:hypothetical protein